MSDATATLERATAAVTDARDAHSAVLGQAIADNAPLPASAAVSKAIAAERDARSQVEAARAGLERLIGDRPDKQVAVHLADAGVVAAINALIAPEATAMIARSEQAMQELQRSLAVLRFLQAPDDVVRHPPRRAHLATAPRVQRSDAPSVARRS